MPRNEIVDVKMAAPNPNLSRATRFGTLVFVAGQTGRHPTTGEVAGTSASRPGTCSSESR